MKIEKDPRVAAALVAITGTEQIRTHVDHDDDGKPRYQDGYTVSANDQAVFVDERNQHHVVPMARVAAHLKANEKPAGK